MSRRLLAAGGSERLYNWRSLLVAEAYDTNAVVDAVTARVRSATEFASPRLHLSTLPAQPSKHRTFLYRPKIDRALCSLSFNLLRRAVCSLGAFRVFLSQILASQAYADAFVFPNAGAYALGIGRARFS